MLADAVARARALEEQVAGIDDLDPAGLALLLDEASTLAGLQEVFHEDFGYAALRLLADASDTEARDLVAECEANARDLARRPPCRRPCGWDRVRRLAEVPRARVVSALARPPGEPGRRAARACRREGIRRAGTRCGRCLGSLVPGDPDRRIRAVRCGRAASMPHGVVELRLLRLHADRDVRRRADEALLGIYEANLQVAAACLDAVIADRLGEDRLRGPERSDGCDARGRRGRCRTPWSCCSRPSSATRNPHALVRAQARGARSRADRALRPRSPRSVILHRSSGPMRSPPPARSSTGCPRASETSRAGSSPSTGSMPSAGRARTARSSAPGSSARNGVFVFLSYIESASGATMLGHEMGHGVHFAAAAAARPWLAAFEPATAAFFEVPSTFAELAAAEHLSTTIGGEAGKALAPWCPRGYLPAHLRSVGDDAVRAGRLRAAEHRARR